MFFETTPSAEITMGQILTPLLLLLYYYTIQFKCTIFEKILIFFQNQEICHSYSTPYSKLKKNDPIYSIQSSKTIIVSNEGALMVLKDDARGIYSLDAYIHSQWNCFALSFQYIKPLLSCKLVIVAELLNHNTRSECTGADAPRELKICWTRISSAEITHSQKHNKSLHHCLCFRFFSRLSKPSTISFSLDLYSKLLFILSLLFFMLHSFTIQLQLRHLAKRWTLCSKTPLYSFLYAKPLFYP